jgi:DNA-binding response OmpR family regulator
MTAPGRVLLLDTDVPFRQTLVAALDRFGIEVSWRARLLGLFDALAESDPVALIVSADLPGSEPLELIRSVRRSRWAELPILMVTDQPDRSFELRAYVDGADAVLERARCASQLSAHVLGYATRRQRRRQGGAREVADAALALTGPGQAGAPGLLQSEHETERWPIEGPFTAMGRPDPAGFSGAPYPESLDAPTVQSFEHGTHPTNQHHTSWGASMAESPIRPPNSTGSTPSPQSGGLVGFADAAVPDVILVDDDPSLLEMLRYALTNRGYRTLSLSNGMDALLALRDLDTGNRRPVVLLDVDLPGLDGFRILHELGGCRPGDYQVILCTIHSSEATQVLGIQSGAVDYIVKPFRMPIVLAKVERLLGPARVNAEV